MIEQIKNKIGSFLLKKETSGFTRKVVATNLDLANSIGVLFNYDSEVDLKIAKQFVKFLREEGIKEVQAIGYVNQKELPDLLTPFLGFDFISKKELNFYLKPIGTASDNFKEKEFDILIDFTEGQFFPLKYLLQVSKAKFKVGKYSEQKKEYYDLMIDVHSGDIRTYLKQVEKYLRMIKVN